MISGNTTVSKNENEKNKQHKLRPQKRKPGFHEDMFNETSYYFRNGLRYVYPYQFTFTAHTKQRWLNLKLLDLFKKEFHMETVEYYEKAIKAGKIRVNNEIVSADRILRSNDLLETTVHRHEPPVVNEQIEFLQNNNEMVVINKPSSIPVHPCGRYRHNTVVFILGKVHELHRLHTIHRIDRLTSGILMFAKTPKKAREMEKAVKGRHVEKEYLARVVGEFPSEETITDEPILTTSHKIGVCQVHPDGKPCSTTFQRLSFNGKSSVLSCKPHTGRMHQIRVHLQWLGYPIVNDPIYNHPTAWGEGKGKKNTNLDVKQVIAELIRTRKDKSYDFELSTDKPDTDQTYAEENHDNKQTASQVESKKRKIASNYLIDENDLDEGVTVRKWDIPDITIASCSGDNTEPSSVGDNDAYLCSENKDSEELKRNFDNEQNDVICDKLKNTKSLAENKIESEESRICYTSLDIGKEYYEPDCTECKRTWKEPFKSELIMYLHAMHYKGPDWEFKSSIPSWAKEDWIDD